MEVLSKIGLTLFFTVVWLIALHWIWTSHIDPRATISRFLHKTTAPPEWVATRESDKIYQDGKVVGDVLGAVEREGLTVRFAQIANTSSFDQGSASSINASA
jgi:hypothetical protein